MVTLPRKRARKRGRVASAPFPPPPSGGDPPKLVNRLQSPAALANRRSMSAPPIGFLNARLVDPERETETRGGLLAMDGVIAAVARR